MILKSGLKITLVNYALISVVRIRNKKQKILASYSFDNTDEMIDDYGKDSVVSLKAKRFYEKCLLADSLKEIKEIAKSFT